MTESSESQADEERVGGTVNIEPVPDPLVHTDVVVDLDPSLETPPVSPLDRDPDSFASEVPSDLAVVIEQVESLGRTLGRLAEQVGLMNRRNLAQEAILERLQDAERQLRATSVHPFAHALNRVLTTIEAVDVDDEVREGLRFEIEEVLGQQGYELFGSVGDDFDATRHEALAGRIAHGTGVIDKLYSRGLICFGKLVTKARVHVVPTTDTMAELNQESSDK